MKSSGRITKTLAAFFKLIRILPAAAFRLPRASHGLAHVCAPLFLSVCVCAPLFLSWSLPGGVSKRASVAGPLSDAEADELLQRAAQSALGGREGTIMVLDAQTGRVRAVVNQRTAFEEATPPGSAVKPFTMLAAMRAGSLDEATRVFCRARYKHEDFEIACSHPRYKRAFGPVLALANSCNYFFARVAEGLDGGTYERTLREFGFGTRTGEGGESEAAGQLPHETPGVAEMLGDSERLRVTPAQLITAYAALFNGGRLLAPRRARAEGFTPSERERIEVEPAQRSLIVAGMRGAVAYGTAARAGLATLPVYVFGKTGTSTPQDGWRSQGWFVGFAAGDNPTNSKAVNNPTNSKASTADAASPEGVRLAVLVFLKRARGAEAAELARPVFETYARTLAERGDSQLAPQSSDEATREASTSTAGSEGTTVRVRLSHDDATLVLPLDDYVFGVLAAEGSVETEPEALKALAVIARTYALKNMNRHARDHFDLCDTTHCQRFALVRDEGARPEFYELAHRAVSETAGEVLRDAEGRVAESYFSAACGGRTADISKLWGVRDAPAYLRGVRDDFCAGASEAWTDVITAAQLLKALRADNRSDVGARLDGVRVVRHDQTGRAELVQLDGERRRTLRGWDFKIIVGRTLGWNVLKSSRFDVVRTGSAYVFRGTGFGHGLGLCQAGAHVMASRGASYREILSRYFPGTSIGGGEGMRISDFGFRNDESDAYPSDSSSPPGDRLETSSTYDADENSSDEDEKSAGEADSLTFQTASYSSRLKTVESAFRLPPSAFEAFSIRNPQSAIRTRLSSEHFRVSYPARASRADAEAALRTLEDAYADVSRRLEKASLGASIPLTEVLFYETTGDFVGATGRPAWVAAVTDGRRIEVQPLDVLRRRGVLASTLRHEFVHAAIESLGGGRAPLWLVEGLAAYVAGEGASLARSAPKARMATDELERRLARPGSPDEMRSLYAAAYAEVAALIRREGEAAVWRRVAR